MRKVLSEKAVDLLIYELGLEWNKRYVTESLKNDKWEITDDKSLDDIRNPSDDKAWPFVILRNEKCFDAITEKLGKELLSL